MLATLRSGLKLSGSAAPLFALALELLLTVTQRFT